MNEKNIIDNSTTPDMLQNNPTDIDSRITTGNDGKYSITIQYVASEGKVSTSHDRAAPGTTVTIVSLSNDGFQCNGVSVISGGVRVDLESYSEYSGKIVSEYYTFTMPSQNVVLQGNFKKIPGGGSSGGGSSGGGGPSGGTDGDNTNPGGDGSNNGQGRTALPNVSGLVGAPFVVPHSDFYSTVYPNAGAHNCIYRGKKLGTAPTAEQYAEIKNGTFNDLFIGDYWETDNNIWRIAAFDYYYGIEIQRTYMNKHHCIIVPDYKMHHHNSTDESGFFNTSPNGGFWSSNLYKLTTPILDNLITNLFGSKILSVYIQSTAGLLQGDTSSTAHRFSLSNKLCKSFFLSESMVLGRHGSSIQSTNKISSFDYSYQCVYDKGQLPLFQIRHDLIPLKFHVGETKSPYLLRDIVSNSGVSSINWDGRIGFFNQGDIFGDIRAAFCIG